MTLDDHVDLVLRVWLLRIVVGRMEPRRIEPFLTSTENGVAEEGPA